MASGRVIGSIAVLAAVIAGAAAPGCSRGPTFTAQEFVDRVDEQGVAIRLGRELSAGSGAEELYAIRLPPLPGEPPASGREGGSGASGSLYVYDDNEGAADQLEGCRGSAGLICYRASNVIVILDEESSRIAAQRLGVAIRRLQ